MEGRAKEVKEMEAMEMEVEVVEMEVGVAKLEVEAVEGRQRQAPYRR